MSGQHPSTSLLKTYYVISLDSTLLCLFSGQYFQRDLPAKFEADPECYFSLAYSLRYNPKKMKKLEKEYTAMKTKEQEELVELKVNFPVFENEQDGR